MGAAAHDRARHPAPRGRELTPINPMPEGTFSPRRRGAAVGHAVTTTRSSSSARMAEVYAGFSEYTDAQVGRDHRLPRGVGAARQHPDPLLRRQRRLRRGQPERIGQREQVLQRLSRRHRGEHGDASTSSASPDTYNHYPTGWAVAFSTRIACSSATPSGWHRAIRWSSTGRRASRRRAKCGTSTTTAPTSCRRSSSAAAWRCPRSSMASSRRRLPGVSMRYSFDDAEAPTHEGDAVLRDARAPAASGTRDGRRSPSTARSDRTWAIRPGPLAALPHRRGPLRGDTISPTSIRRRSRS